jgi:hypothetical protein
LLSKESAIFLTDVHACVSGCGKLALTNLYGLATIQFRIAAIIGWALRFDGGNVENVWSGIIATHPRIDGGFKKEPAPR